MFRGSLNNNDYNNLTESGYYKIEDNVINGPNTYWGTLVVFNDGYQITQKFYTNINNNPIYIRRGGISILGSLEWRVISIT